MKRWVRNLVIPAIVHEAQICHCTDQPPDSLKTYASFYTPRGEKGFRIRSRSCKLLRGRCLTRLVSLGVLGKFLDPWTLGPLSSWRLILHDSFPTIRIMIINLSHPKDVGIDEWWCRNGCLRSVYVVEKFSSVSCILPPICIQWDLVVSWR